MGFDETILDNSSEKSAEHYTSILSYIYPIFLGTTLVSHVVLLIFIRFFSPPHLKILRVLLSITSFFDVLATVSNFFIQPRIASGGDINVPVYCYGLCRYMSSRFCFSIYMGWQTISLAVGISMTYTLFFKYHKLSFKGPLKGKKLFISLFCFYFPCFVSMICSIIIVLRNSLPNEMMRKSENFLVEPYSEIKYSLIGKMILRELPNKINFCMMAIGIYTSPFLAFWFRWKSNKQLNSTITGSSPFLRRHVTSVMTGVSIQVTIHFLFYIPLFSLYSYSIISGTEVLFQQFFLAMSPNLAASLDPLINLYYVVPYRKRIKSWVWPQPEVTPIRVVSLTPSA